MYSISANNGVMRMGVNFDVKTDPNIDQVLAQLRERQAEAQLPQSVQNYGVTLLKSPSSPMMLIGLSSPNGTHDATFLANYAYINLVDQITQLKGVSNIKDVYKRQIQQKQLFSALIPDRDGGQTESIFRATSVAKRPASGRL